MMRDLRKLLNPRSVAVVGATSREGSLVSRLFALRDRLGSEVELVGVNPNRTGSIGDVQVYPSCAALPGPTDAAVIALPASKVLPAVQELESIGTRDIVVISSGFGETTSGADLQRELVEFAQAKDLNVAGPNCVGAVNLVTGALTSIATFLDSYPVSRGPVAAIGQSGGMVGLCYSLGVEAGIGFSHLISTGNEADVDLADYLDFMAEDPDTTVVCAYVESLRRGRDILRAGARLRNAGKHVIVLKGGRSQVGADASRSHTGALASDDRVFRALCREAGIAVVSDLTELVGAAVLATRAVARPINPRLGILANSGGTAVQAADRASDAGLEIPEFAASTVAEISQHLPDYARSQNPVDITPAAFSEADRVRAPMQAVIDDPAVGAVALVSSLGIELSERLAETLAPLLAGTSKLPMVIWYAPSEPVRQSFRSRGVPLFEDPGIAFRSLAALAAVTSDPPRCRGLAVAAEPEGTFVTEDEMAKMLAEAGVPVLQGRLATTAHEASERACETGFPVVMKVIAQEIPHRAALGLVRLNLRSTDEVLTAGQELLDRVGSETGARLYVQPYVQAQHELFVGVKDTRDFGPLMLVGAGGTGVEATADVQVTRLPLEPKRAGELADGAVTELLLQLSDWFCKGEHGLSELDLNPILLTDSGPVIVDALGVRP